MALVETSGAPAARYFAEEVCLQIWEEKKKKEEVDLILTFTLTGR